MTLTFTALVIEHPDGSHETAIRSRPRLRLRPLPTDFKSVTDGLSGCSRASRHTLSADVREIDGCQRKFLYRSASALFLSGFGAYPMSFADAAKISHNRSLESIRIVARGLEV